MAECAARVRALALALGIATTGWPLQAQSGLDLLDDASTPRRGMLRFRSALAFTRYDARFTPSGVQPLGFPFTAGALGSEQLSALSPIQTQVSALSGNPFALSLGASRVDAMGRAETLPFIFEYGVTNRLSVSVTVPVERRRAAVQFQLDSAGSNVGPNLQRTSSAAQATNAAVQLQFAGAAQQLATRLADCDADPAATGCAALLARRAEAEALIASSTDFAETAATLYGGGASSGQLFVPRVDSDAQLAIAARIAQFNADYQDLLSTTADVLTAVPVGAAGPAGIEQVQAFLFESGSDSLVMQERLGIGDVGIGVRALLIDRPATPEQRLAMLVSVGGGVRLPTGSIQSTSELVDMSLGAGSMTFEGSALADVQFARVGLLAAVRMEAGDPQVEMPRDAQVIAVQFAPRWNISSHFAVHGAFVQRSGDVSKTTRFAGGGVSFVERGRPMKVAGRPLPIEMRYTHLEAMSGAPGQPKVFRDQVEVRIYVPLLAGSR